MFRPLAMLAALLATFWLVAISWLPLTASLLLALRSPSATGHLYGGIDTGLGQARTACDFHTVVVNGGVAGFDAVYNQVFVQLNGHCIALGFRW